MRTALFTFILATTGFALAEDEAAEAPAEEEAAVDCSTLEGDEKAKCEEDQKKAEEAEKAEEPKKGGKASRSSAGNMNLESDDE